MLAKPTPWKWGQETQKEINLCLNLRKEIICAVQPYLVLGCKNQFKREKAYPLKRQGYEYSVWQSQGKTKIPKQTTKKFLNQQASQKKKDRVMHVTAK